MILLRRRPSGLIAAVLAVAVTAASCVYWWFASSVDLPTPTSPIGGLDVLASPLEPVRPDCNADETIPVEARVSVPTSWAHDCASRVDEVLKDTQGTSTRRLIDALRALGAECGDGPTLAALSNPARKVRFRGRVVSGVFADSCSTDAIDASRAWIRRRLEASALEWAEDSGFIELLSNSTAPDDQGLLLSLVHDGDTSVAIAACAVIAHLPSAALDRVTEIACERANESPSLAADIIHRVCAAAPNGIHLGALAIVEDASRPLEVRRAVALGVARGADWATAAGWIECYAGTAADDAISSVAFDALETLAERLGRDVGLDCPRNRAHIAELIDLFCATPWSMRAARPRCALLVQRWR